MSKSAHDKCFMPRASLKTNWVVNQRRDVGDDRVQVKASKCASGGSMALTMMDLDLIFKTWLTYLDCGEERHAGSWYRRGRCRGWEEDKNRLPAVVTP